MQNMITAIHCDHFKAKGIYMYIRVYFQSHSTIMRNIRFTEHSSILYYLYQNWLAFVDLHRPPFLEHRVIHFMNNKPPSDDQNHAFCKVSYGWKFYNILSAYDPISNFRSCLAHEGFIKCKLISNHSDIHAFFTFYEGLTKVIRIFTRAVI